MIKQSLTRCLLDQYYRFQALLLKIISRLIRDNELNLGVSYEKWQALEKQILSSHKPAIQMFRFFNSLCWLADPGNLPWRMRRWVVDIVTGRYQSRPDELFRRFRQVFGPNVVSVSKAITEDQRTVLDKEFLQNYAGAPAEITKDCGLTREQEARLYDENELPLWQQLSQILDDDLIMSVFMVSRGCLLTCPNCCGKNPAPFYPEIWNKCYQCDGQYILLDEAHSYCLAISQIEAKNRPIRLEAVEIPKQWPRHPSAANWLFPVIVWFYPV